METQNVPRETIMPQGNVPRETSSSDNIGLDKKSLEFLVALAELTANERKAYSEDKLSTYKPHAGQLEFHKAEHLIRLLITGNRFGKSTASVIEALWLANGLHPFKKLRTPNKGRIYGESYTILNLSIIPKILEWCPQKLLASNKPFQKNPDGNIIGVNFACGSILTFGTYDQQAKKSESTDWDYIGFDEPPAEDIWKANFRGLIDRGGWIWISATPLSEPWVFDNLWVPGITGKKKYVKCITGSSYDNPYSNKEVLGIYFDELTDDEKEIRIHGKFIKLKGLVIDTYQPALSDIDPFLLDSSYTIYEGIDPHPGKPNAVLWKAVNKQGRRYVVRELKFDNGIYKLGKEISRIRKELCAHGALLYESICDTSLNQKDLGYRINQRDELIRSLKEEGETVFPQNAQKKDWLYPGIQKLKDLYRPVKQILEISDGFKVTELREVVQPMQFVFNNCTAYKYEMSHYQWPKGDMTDVVKPKAIWNDLLDCDRYIESLAPGYQTPGQSGIIRTFDNAYSRLPNRYNLPKKPHPEIIQYQIRSFGRTNGK